jgi:predicted metal-dependent RNase
MPARLERSEVVAMLATYGDRSPEQVPEAIDSLELAWLIHQVEQRYGAIDIDDEAIARMSTVTGAVDALRDLKTGPGNRVGQ